jgi:hypothetical protein
MICRVWRVDVAFGGGGLRDLGLRLWDDVAESQQAGRVSAMPSTPEKLLHCGK